MKQTVKVVLASASPRRKELLERAGIEFEIVKSEKEEVITKSVPSEVVAELAAQKAEDVKERLLLRRCLREETLIVAADTVVVSERKILGKPENEEDALNILMSLSGKEHSVYTGVCALFMDEEGKILPEKSIYLTEETVVEMFPFTEEEAMAYIATGEPMDKAGAYGIQGIGGILVKEIRGDYNNVVGFPLSAFVRLGCQKNFFHL